MENSLSSEERYKRAYEMYLKKIIKNIALTIKILAVIGTK